MKAGTILVTVNSAVDPAAQLDVALNLAERVGGEIEALYVRPNISAELAYASDLMSPHAIDYPALEQLSRERAGRVRSRFEAWSARHAAARSICTWHQVDGFLEDVVERRGRFSDYLVLRHPDARRPDTERVFESAVFGSGRPCLVIDKSATDLLDRILVAWNGSLQGARAVGGAMPLLCSAKTVSIFCAADPDEDDEHGDELARALAKRDIAAHIVRYIKRNNDVGAELVNAAADIRATLIVLGAYTHSRLRQRLLGGVTRHVLSHAPVPLLVAH